MSTVRGDTETAAQIASSGQPLPWQVRWAHWRPPGALNAAYARPAPSGVRSVNRPGFCSANQPPSTSRFILPRAPSTAARSPVPGKQARPATQL